MPLLEVLTRCYRRPRLLAANQASLDALVGDSWIQTLVVDEVGRGVAWANANLATLAGDLVGDYIWILDDDDRCVRPTLLSELRALVEVHDPDVVMVRMDHGPLGVLPDDAHWGQAPVEGQFGCSSYIVRRPVWAAHAPAWRSARYASDFDFLNSIWAAGPVVVWHDVIASAVQRISYGAPELCMPA